MTTNDDKPTTKAALTTKATPNDYRTPKGEEPHVEGHPVRVGDRFRLKPRPGGDVGRERTVVAVLLNSRFELESEWPGEPGGNAVRKIRTKVSLRTLRKDYERCGVAPAPGDAPASAGGE